MELFKTKVRLRCGWFWCVVLPTLVIIVTIAIHVTALALPHSHLWHLLALVLGHCERLFCISGIFIGQKVFDEFPMDQKRTFKLCSLKDDNSWGAQTLKL